MPRVGPASVQNKAIDNSLTVILGPRMPFSIRCGLTLLCLTMLPLLHAQVISPVITENQGKHPGPAPICCMEASRGAFNEPVTACFEQKENTFQGCRVHAYIFHTTSNNDWCADPGAWWIPRRLKRLQQRGIYCQVV
uniref:Chemokine interleukin-8-like domain-containing protein n=1 Tax=Sparus aurata TaxID=8175 RepID=A0A671YF01_SPAAU